MAKTSTTRLRFTATPFAWSRRYLNRESRLAGSPEVRDAQIVPNLLPRGGGRRSRSYRLRSHHACARDAAAQRKSRVHVVDRYAHKRSGSEGPATTSRTGLGTARQDLIEPPTRSSRWRRHQFHDSSRVRLRSDPESF